MPTDPKPVSVEEVAREIASVAGAPIEGCSEAFNMSLKMAIPTVARRVLPILARHFLAAKIEALEGVARNGCYFCARPGDFPPAAFGEVARWWHASATVKDAYQCTRSEVHDALSKLRALRAQAQEGRG